MRLATYLDSTGRERVGALSADATELVDLSAEFDTMLTLIEAGHEGLERARRTASRASERAG